MSRTAIALMLLPAILASVLLATKAERRETQALAAESYLFNAVDTQDARMSGAREDAALETADLPDDPQARLVAVGAAILYGLEWSRR